jgi:hypothetical protein
MDTLTPTRVRHTDHCHLADLGMLAQQRFHLGRVDVLAAGDEHVLRAIDDGEVALLVDTTYVADPPESIRCHRRGSGLRIVPVAVEGFGSPDHDLARFSHRHIVEIVPDDPYLPVEGRLAGGTQVRGLGRVIGRLECRDREATCLGATVVLPESATQGLDRRT